MTGMTARAVAAASFKPVSESSALPGTSSRFSRKRHDKSAAPRGGAAPGAASGNAPQEPATELDICEQLLTDGYVQSYVDFFHLTHRVDPSIVDPAHAGTKLQVPLKDMVFLRDNLVAAESSRRQGHTQGVYHAFNHLADFYELARDYDTSIFFHEKSLDVATMTSDVRAEMSANHALGSVYQQQGNHASAARHHEQHLDLAQSLEIFDEIVKASTQLYRVYTTLAEALLAADADSGAGAGAGAADTEAQAEATNAVLELLHQSLESAKKAMDKSAEGEANAKIGTLLLKRGHTEECVPYLRAQSQIAADNGNPESRCRACSALALAFDTMGQADKALAELMLVSTISEQAGDVLLQSTANRALGTLYSKVGELDKSVEALARHFALLSDILGRRAELGEAAAHITARDLDLARVYLGVSRGNAQMGQYFVAVQFDFDSLLDWKLGRAALPSSRALMGEERHRSRIMDILSESGGAEAEEGLPEA